MEKTTKPPVAEPAKQASPAANSTAGSSSTSSTSHHLPSADELKGKWKSYVGEAKVLWGKLTDDELLQTEGHLQKLAGLVQQRYAITREAAEKQVHDFLNKHK
jgi:uncharacterized protein YjbJ (UPF0337 family)